MSSTYTFWTQRGHVEPGSGASAGGLTIFADSYSGDQFTLYQHKDTTPDEMLQIADRVLDGVTAWRNRIAEVAEKSRTIADELAAPQARIAELEQAAEGSDS